MSQRVVLSAQDRHTAQVDLQGTEFLILETDDLNLYSTSEANCVTSDSEKFVRERDERRLRV